ncbi:MAG: hypothetical protein ACLFQV_03250, partial [Vulcanimicrobiota bacterium]
MMKTARFITILSLLMVLSLVWGWTEENRKPENEFELYRKLILARNTDSRQNLLTENPELIKEAFVLALQNVITKYKATHQYEALEKNQEILTEIYSLKHNSQLTHTLFELGRTQLILQKFSAPVQTFNSALDSLQNHNDPELKARIFTHLAQAYLVLPDYENADKYALQALALSRKNQYKSLMAENYRTLSV